MPARSPGFSSTGPAVVRMGSQLGGNHVRQRRFAQSRGPVQQHVIERFGAVAGRSNRHLKVVPNPVLTNVVVERARPEPGLVLGIFVDAGCGDRPGLRHGTYAE